MNIYPLTSQSAAPVQAVETITMLTCQIGIAAKTIRPGGTTPYKAGKHFRWEEVPCSSLDDLHQTLVSVEDRRKLFAIRGEPCDRSKPDQAVVRRSNGSDATFRDVPRRWLMLDIDGVDAPAGVDPTSAEALAYVVSLLPPEFQGVSFIAQWSSSAGLKPGLIKVHLWYWLEKPLSSADLKAWAKDLALLPTGRPLIDPAPFHAVQPHYTARPIFEGRPDPVPVRTFLVKLPKDAVALEPPKRSTPTMAHLSHPPVSSPSPSMPLGTKITDGREQWLLLERYRTLRADAPETFQEFKNAVWERFSSECETGVTASSSNSYTAANITEKCSYDWDRYKRGEFDFQKQEALTVTLPPFPDRTVPLEEGLAQLSDKIRGFFADPKHTVIRITSGAGKTVTACRAMVKALQDARQNGLRKVVHIYASTHKLKEEIALTLMKLDRTFTIKNVIGRVPGNCARYALTSQLRDLRLSIQRVCCDASRANGFEGAALKHLMKCPYFDTCNYQQQFDDTADVYLFAKQYLHASRRADVAAPDYVVIDEEFISTLVQKHEAGLEDLLKLPPNTSTEARRAVQVIRDALAMTEPVLKNLRDAGFDAAALRQCALDINLYRTRRLGLNVLPGMEVGDIARQAFGIGPEHIGYLALKALEPEIEHSRDESYSVIYQDSKLFVRLLRDSEVFQTPTLVLDATADSELIRAVLPTAEFHAIDVPRNAHVIQIHNRRLSKYSLTRDKNTSQTLAHLQGALERITPLYPTGLLVTFKSLQHSFAIPATWRSAHFGDIRGVDAYKDLGAIVIVGTYLVPPLAVEHEAGALAARLPEQRLFTGHYTDMKRAFRLRFGEAEASIWGHPDSFVQRVLEQKREAELLQSVDRVRLVHSQQEKPVFIFSNLPLDLPVDELVTLEQLAGPDDFLGKLLDHLGGVVPLRASLLHESRPDLFPTEKVAEKWAAPYTPKPQLIYIRQAGVKEVRARSVGQRGPSDTRVLVRSDHPAPLAAIEHLLGPLATYDGPPDQEVIMHATMPDSNRVVAAKVVQFINPGFEPPGWKRLPLPPSLYWVLNPPKELFKKVA